MLLHRTKSGFLVVDITSHDDMAKRVEVYDFHRRKYGVSDE